MQEQNFERQVKETMEGYTIPPSAPVWQKIEGEIRQKKERRKLVLWILPILLAGGGLWLLLNTESPEKMDAANSSAQNQSKPSNVPAGTSPADTNEDADKDEQSSVVPSIASPQKTSIATSKRSAAGKQEPAITGNRSEKKYFRNKIRETVQSKKPSVSGIQKNTDEAGKSSPSTPLVNTEEPVKEFAETIAPVESKQKEEEKKEEVIQSLTDSASAETQTSPASPSSRPRKWKFSLQVTGGFAQTMQSFFPLTRPAQPDATPTSNGFISRDGSKDPGPAMAFSAGVGLTTTVSTRVKFTTGLQYQYASTSQPYGQKFDGGYQINRSGDSASGYTFTSGSAAEYINRYHFVELPAGIDVKLFSTLPVAVHMGASVSGIIRSNSLCFDENRDAYYRNAAVTKKLAVNLFGGFSYSILKDRMQLGPHLQYTVTPLQKTPGDNRYLLTAGVRARLSLN